MPSNLKKKPSILKKKSLAAIAALPQWPFRIPPLDWRGLLTRKSVDRCINLFYDIMWYFFERFVPMTSPNSVWKFP
jgi:hypothetical protein